MRYNTIDTVVALSVAFFVNAAILVLAAVVFFGHDKVMYAMDYPYEYVKEEVDMMDNLPITPEQKKMFFQTNAERIFKLP